MEPWDEIVDLYKRGLDSTLDAFKRTTNRFGNTAKSEEIVGRMLRVQYNSAVTGLQRIDGIRPGQFDLAAKLKEMEEYRVERYSEYIQNTPSPKPEKPLEEMEPGVRRAVEILRGIHKQT
jgi:hypothetical protein